MSSRVRTPLQTEVSRRGFLGTGLAAAVGLGLAGCTEDGRAAFEPTDAWTQFRFDAANTGVNPDAVAPGGEVSVVWSYESGRRVDPPVVTADGVYIGDGTLNALDLNGDERWSVPLHTEGIAADGDRLFVGTTDGVGAYGASDGERDWFRDIGRTMPPTLVDDALYVVTDEGSVYRLSATDGSDQWQLRVERQVLCPLAYADGAVYVASSARDPEASEGFVRRIDADTGEERWSFETGSVRFSAPVVAGEAVFVPAHTGTVYAIGKADGAERWAFDAGEEFTCPPAVADGTLYLGSQAGTLYALDTDDGAERWAASGVGFVNSGPTVADGTVFLGTNRGLFAVDADSGDSKWRVETDRNLFGVVPSGGGLLAGSFVSRNQDESATAKLYAFAEPGSG